MRSSTAWAACLVLFLATVLPSGIALAWPFGESPLPSGWILAAANSGGSHGTFWKTDVWIHNPGRDAAEVAFFLLPAGRPGVDGESVGRIRVEPGETSEVHNILGTLLGVLNPVGALEYRVVSGPSVYVQSRTYSGPSESPPIPASGSEDAGTSWDPLHLDSLRPSREFRTNLSLVNPGNSTLELDIEILDDQDRLVERLEAVLARRSYYPLVDVLAGVTGRFRNGRVVIRPRGNGRVLALSSVIAASSGDASMTVAVRESQRPLH